MSTSLPSVSVQDFEPIAAARAPQRIVRPAQTYWQDAWRRLKANRRAYLSWYIVLALGLFTLAGPWVWRVDPAAQNVDRASEGPALPATATIVAPYEAWAGPARATVGTAPGAVPANVRAAEPPNTLAVRLAWDIVPSGGGYRLYRNMYDPAPDRALGLPVVDLLDPQQAGFEDRFDLEPRPYWYSLVTLDATGQETQDYAVVRVDVRRVISAAEAEARGWIDSAAAWQIGDDVRLPWHPLGTDYLGRDLLARLMVGARVSLFIGIAAPFLFVLAGIAYGSAAGFVGGRLDQVLMRFADFVVALPFLLFMILFKIAFGIGPGESGIVPMLIALVLLGWPGTARLVRGQILQLREESYIAASRLLGAPTGYLVLRHMIPNTLGVILVTLTFAVPSVIFTEAFLSFIGMGVAPPTPSWGSMSNEGIRTMLSHPHELVFPALFISVTVLAFNLLGDGLRDALDVRMRGRE
jgi:oligopeptide transport system permease protein